ncbi:DUF6694 family lipoprotein [Ruminobacter sp.]|uniref:DUF6694 family lipoprotein n=1 Tax=Ruminobacter sp. TaxID=2774296 RepID=UPI0038659CA2
MNYIKYFAVSLFALGLMGCSPKIDTTSYESAEVSITKMADGLSDEKKIKFGNMIKFYSTDEKYLLCPMCAAKDLLSVPPELIQKRAMEKLAQLNGMTFEEIEKKYDEEYPKFLVKLEKAQAEQMESHRKFREQFERSFLD